MPPYARTCPFLCVEVREVRVEVDVRKVLPSFALVGLPYSGQLGFVETEMTWPINHMVSPKGDAVGCAECHTRKGSRLASLTDFYLPGRDANRWVDGLGRLAIGLALAGSGLHLALRIAAAQRRPRRSAER